MTLTRTLFTTLALGLATAGVAGGSVNLTSHVFSSANLPYVWTDEALPAPYRLRVKIGGTHHATTLYNNNWTRLESVPAPGTYLVETYWVLYDSANWSVAREIGPFSSGTITIQPSSQPPYARSVSATAASPGQVTTLTGSASDGNGDLAWLHFFTNDPNWSGYVHAGSAHVGARSDATASVAWTVPAGARTGTYQAHLRSVDATGLWDWNGGANASFSVRASQPTVYSQNSTGAVGRPFTPQLLGGAGTGPWQWVIAGRTNWGGTQPGTLLPPANTPSPSWVPDTAGDYYYWIIRQGDASYLPSNIAGPYLLSVRGNPPLIVAQPSSLSVTAGTPASFSVAATGDAPFSYQWARNGVALPGATQAQLVLPAAQLVDAGGYTVTVRNASGAATSAAAALTVRLLPPSIVVGPSGQSVPAGQTVVLSVSAAGSPPLAYRWSRDGAEIAGATSASLPLLNVQSAQAGAYAVSVANAAGSATSSPAIVSVLPAPPVITRQPAAAVAQAGQTVQFSVEATGSQPLAFQWRRDGIPIAGATSSVLTLATARASDAAAAPGYAVIVSNVAGSTTSAAAALTVVETPPIRLALQYWRENDFPDRSTGNGQWIEEEIWVEAHWEESGRWEDTDGDGFEETWIVDGWIWVPAGMRTESRWVEEIAADGLLGSQWATTVGTFGSPALTPGTALASAASERGHLLESYRPGANDIALRAWALAPAGNCRDFRFAVFQPNGAATGLTGTIPPGGFTDIRVPTWMWGSGFYRVDLTYHGASATALPSAKTSYWIALGQGLPPRIQRHPTPAQQRVAAGAAVSYSVAATEAAAFQWLKDGNALAGATTATLLLPAITSAQAGTYRVQAINAAGRTTSDPVILEVEVSSSADSDADGLPDSIERLLGLNSAAPATADPTNATLRLRINTP